MIGVGKVGKVGISYRFDPVALALVIFQDSEGQGGLSLAAFKKATKLSIPTFSEEEYHPWVLRTEFLSEPLRT